MRLLRAGQRSAPPLNCSVMRHLASVSEECAKTFLLTSLLAFSAWSSDVLACDPGQAAEAMETEDYPRVHEQLVDCDRSDLSGLSLAQLGWATVMLTDPNDDRAWAEAWRRAFDLFLLGSRKGEEDAILIVVDLWEEGDPDIGIAAKPRTAACLLEATERNRLRGLIDPDAVAVCLDGDE
jgi:hypothetical protein